MTFSPQKYLPSGFVVSTDILVGCSYINGFPFKFNNKSHDIIVMYIMVRVANWLFKIDDVLLVK